MNNLHLYNKSNFYKFIQIITGGKTKIMGTKNKYENRINSEEQ